METRDGTVSELAEHLRKPWSGRIHGDEYLLAPEGWEVIDTERPEHLAPSLLFYSLRGLADYVKSGFDSKEALLVHVENPTSVNVYESVRGGFRQRPILAMARVGFEASSLLAEDYVTIEDFIIGLKTGFVLNAGAELLVRAFGNLKDENVRSINDDGLTQTITARTGAALVGAYDVPPIVLLAPYRTFREISQPESEFLVRMQSGGPTAALFSADGGAWELVARESIANFLYYTLGLKDTIHQVLW